MGVEVNVKQSIYINICLGGKGSGATCFTLCTGEHGCISLCFKPVKELSKSEMKNNQAQQNISKYCSWLKES